MRAAVYARVSTDEQVEGTSLGTQVERCGAYAKAKGWTVVGEYVDEGVSGAKASRPRLDRLMAACRAGEVDAVVVAKLDRFTRSKRHLENAVHELDELGVAFVSVAESVDSTTASGRMFRSLLGAFAEFEREQIGERTLTGIRSTAKAGYWPGGPPPFGLKLVRDGNHTRVEIDDDEAAVVRTAASLVLDGCSTWDATDRLNALGLRPRRAERWEAVNLRRVLLQEHLGGRCAWSKSNGKGGEPVTFSVPAVLDAATHAALIAALRATSKPRSVNRFYPLSGRLFGICGGRFHGVHRKDRLTRQYRCGNSLPTVECRCADKRLNADDLEWVVWDAVRELLTEPERLLALAEEYLGTRGQQMTVERAQLEEIEARLAKAGEALARAYAHAFKAGADGAALQAATVMLEQERDALARHRDQLLDWRDATAEGSERMRMLWELAEVAHTRLKTMTPEDKAAVLSLLDVRVTVLEHRTETTPPRILIEGEVHGEKLLDHVRAGTSTSEVPPSGTSDVPHDRAEVADGRGNVSDGVPRRSTCCRP